VRTRCEEIFKLLKAHEKSQLFIKPLERSHPKFDQLCGSYMNLISIENDFIMGKYDHTYALRKDFRQMFAYIRQLYTPRSPELDDIREMENYFEDL